MNFWRVDTFTNRLFSGNPAVVWICQEFPETTWMINMAWEMGTSESCFVVPISDTHFKIRWFTPKLELHASGYTTLAAAHILWTEHGILSQEIYFESTDGVQKASRESDGGIVLDLPLGKVLPISSPRGLSEVLNATPVFVGRANDMCFVELATVKQILRFVPDQRFFEDLTYNGVLITASGNEEDEFDFISRYFAPRVGVQEDSVTLSAHTYLASYWGDVLQKECMRAYQASERGGWIELRHDQDRVWIKGRVVTVALGSLKG